MREGNRRLGNDAKLDPALDEQGGDHQRRDDLNQPVVTGSKEAHRAIDADDAHEVVGELLQLSPGAMYPEPLAAGECNLIGVVAQVNQRGAEGGLVVELVVVKLHQRVTEANGEPGADAGIGHGDAEQQRADRPEHAGECQHRQSAVGQHQRVGQSAGGEDADILGQTLVGIFHPGGILLQPIVDAVVGIAAKQMPGQPFAP